MGKIIKIVKWFLTNPWTASQKIFSNFINLSEKPFDQLILDYKNTLTLISFDELLKKYNLKLNRKATIIKRFDYKLSMYNLERQIICDIVKAIKPKVFFEIGTYEGETTLNILIEIAGLMSYSSN